MFSGIVEAKSVPLKVVNRDQVVELHLKKPSYFNDIKVGDSIAVNGVCLTVEDFSQENMQFAIAAETLHITSWTAENLNNQEFNLERSLRLDDRVHGHFVTGHVDCLGEVKSVEKLGENLLLSITFPKKFSPYFWNKGSVAINGVSLTLNKVADQTLEVCLIPETLKKTNLLGLEAGKKVNLEVDNFARGLLRSIELGLVPSKEGQ